MTDFGLFVVTVTYGALLVNHARELRRLRNELDALQEGTPMSVLNDHDPLCRSYYRGLIPHDECTDCAFIRRVRADERTQILAAAGLTWDTAAEALQEDGK